MWRCDASSEQTVEIEERTWNKPKALMSNVG
jgi:hypothetical protein